MSVCLLRAASLSEPTCTTRQNNRPGRLTATSFVESVRRLSAASSARLFVLPARLFVKPATSAIVVRRATRSMARAMVLLALPTALALSAGHLNLLDPVHVFNIDDIGLKGSFEVEAIAASFENLVPDHVSIDANGASMSLQRQRRYGAYEAYVSSTSAKNVSLSFREGITSFTQEVDDFRNASRSFEPLEPSVRDSAFLHGLIRTATVWAAGDQHEDASRLLTSSPPLPLPSSPPHLLTAAASMFGAHSTGIRANVSVHQVRQICAPGRASDNAPEGYCLEVIDRPLQSLLRELLRLHHPRTDRASRTNPTCPAVSTVTAPTTLSLPSC